MTDMFGARLSLCSALVVALCASAPASAEPVQFGGGDGSSQDRAVVILDATNETEGVRAEHVWQAHVHPRWRWSGEQATFRRDGRLFDLIRLRGPDGPHDLWFDITSFFGKT